LALAYGADSCPSQMLKSVVFSAVSLDGNPANLQSGPVKLKLFLDPDGDGYAEVFANIELDERKFYFNEKDPEYRQILLSALTAA